MPLSRCRCILLGMDVVFGPSEITLGGVAATIALHADLRIHLRHQAGMDWPVLHTVEFEIVDAAFVLTPAGPELVEFDYDSARDLTEAELDRLRASVLRSARRWYGGQEAQLRARADTIRECVQRQRQAADGAMAWLEGTDVATAAPVSLSAAGLGLDPL